MIPINQKEHIVDLCINLLQTLRTDLKKCRDKSDLEDSYLATCVNGLSTIMNENYTHYKMVDILQAPELDFPHYQKLPVC